MLTFNSLLIFSENPKTLAEFYQKVFDTKPAWEAEGYTTWKVGNGYITVGPHSEVKGNNKDAARLIFNFETDNVKGEFARIKGLGAEIIKDPYAPDETGGEGEIATFADPEGNYFQLMSPMPME